jgi:hypothetical protein
MVTSLACPRWSSRMPPRVPTKPSSFPASSSRIAAASGGPGWTSAERIS